MDADKNIHTFHTLVLGTEGAGKTVFLASMYQYLSIQHEQTGFYLKATPEQHRELINLYQIIRDPELPWPPTTTKVNEWDFTCVVRKQVQNYPVFNFIYYDYPGELLTENQDKGSATFQDFNRCVQDADTWLVILDGEKIKAWIDKVPGSLQRKTNIMQDLDFMLPCLEQGLRPTHFLVTKWDVLNGETTNGESNRILIQVKSELMKHRGFSSIVNSLHQAGMPARLIPVSSVGFQFASPDAHGGMNKQPNEQPVPYQVEMPIALILIDAFQANHVRLNLKQQEILHKVRSSKIWSKFVSETALLESLPLLPKFKLSKQALSLLVEFIEDGLSKKTFDALLQEQIEASRKVRNLATAMKVMILNYAVVAKRLLDGYPASDLTRKD